MSAPVPPGPIERPGSGLHAHEMPPMGGSSKKARAFRDGPVWPGPNCLSALFWRRGNFGRNASGPGDARAGGSVGFDQAAIPGGFPHGLLQFLEGPHLDLADAFAADIVLGRKVFERCGLVLQPPLGDDVALAIVE